MTTEKNKILKNANESMKSYAINLEELKHKTKREQLLLEQQTQMSNKAILNQRIAQAKLFDTRKLRDMAKVECSEHEKQLINYEQDLSVSITFNNTYFL